MKIRLASTAHLCMVLMALLLRDTYADKHLSYGYDAGDEEETDTTDTYGSADVPARPNGKGTASGSARFNPSGQYRCTTVCYRDSEELFRFDDTQTWEAGAYEGIYKIVSGGASPGYNASFTVLQNPVDDFDFDGTMYSFNTPVGMSPPYNDGYPLDYQPPGDAPWPQTFYDPPLGNYRVWFDDENNYHAYRLQMKPNGPNTCNVPNCERVG